MPIPHVADPLGVILLRLQRSLERELIQGLQAGGYPDIRMRQLSVLDAVGAEGAKAAALAARFDMTKQSMGELIDDLERSGYLGRAQDPSDRRARILELTPRGKVATEQCRQIVQAIERRYESLLGASRYHETRMSLTALLQHLEDDPVS
ncbi:MarR family winged helix-turn-helix transcriptional regulator [Paenarthrobacter histidinolovorans]|uniref:DNA-binding MarR family transcriptional regulator n=1 Tax=Paenarthrobacter histidinolovorans TaxID=43664 RepID=A0ABW8N148_9MICC